MKYMLKASIFLLDASGAKKVTCDLPGKVLSSKQMHGTKKYILRDTLLQNSQIYFNDSVTFLLEAEICLPDTKVSITEFAEEDEVRTVINENELLERDIRVRMQTDFTALLRSGSHTDMVIRCGAETIPCHKAILAARSPVFSAMFQHNMTEARTHEVDIPDLTPHTVNLMLEYIYGGVYTHDSATEDLLPTADKYELTGLKGACEVSLSRGINLTNCLDLLILADTHSATKLQKSCLRFIVKNLSKIMSSLSWQTKLSSHPNIMAQILKATAQQAEEKERGAGSEAKRRKKELTSFASLFSSRSGSSDSDED